jgi:hypothetical protein
MYRPAFSLRQLIGSAAVIVCAGALVAALTLTGVAAARTPACAKSGLVVWLANPPGGGTAGTEYFDLEFANLSGHACTLTGYPGVSAVSLGGPQLGSAAGRNAAHPVRAVTLASGTSASMAGATATAVLGITDVGAFSPRQCGPVTAAGLRVYPPNQTASSVVPYPFRGCSRRGLVYLHVESVQKGIPSDG